MLKPVTILALDDDAAALAEAVQRRVAAAYGLDDLVQWRRAAVLAEAIHSIHVQRQRPDSALRSRDDISARELVLVVVSAAGDARAALLGTLAEIRTIYEMRRLASYFSIEVLCVLPEVAGATTDADYAAAYGVLKALSGADPKPFDEAWLLDATNSARVKFGTLATALDAYADAVAGMLTFEPEMSGALPGVHPRGMSPAFSSFGCAELIFPRDAALQRLETRFAAELFGRLCGGAEGARRAPLLAKQFIVGEELALPLSRIGGESLFRRFQPKTIVGEKTRSAEELIAGARAELQQHRDSVHLKNLRTLDEQRDAATAATTALLSRTIDEALDCDGYAPAIALAEALVDPLPDVRDDADAAPRNVVTEIRAATAALDARVRFTPNTAASAAARKRVRELSTMLVDQKLVAETVAAEGAAEQLAELERERAALLQQLPDIVFAEEAENNAARNAAREAEAARLAGESEAKEQHLRELFAQKPRAEQALREALETRRAWLWRRLGVAAGGVAAIVALKVAFEIEVRWPLTIFLIAFGAHAAFKYATAIAPLVRNARETLARLLGSIDATDKAKNAAYNDELQFEHDVAHRRATLAVFRRLHESAKEAEAALRARREELEQLAAATATMPLVDGGLTIALVDETEVDAWYERTAEDRKPFVRDFPIGRAASRHMTLDELRARVAAYAASAFAPFRAMTVAAAATSVAAPASLARRLKRLADLAAPLIELRDDDADAQKAMQRDATLWTDESDVRWLRQLRERFAEAQVKGSPDPLRVHVMTRTLHYPAYVIGQIDYMRTHYDAAANRAAEAFPDLLPTDLAVTGAVRAAYEQVLLCRAVGIPTATLGDTTLAAAKRLSAADAAALRRNVADALAPRLTVAADVARGLRSLRDGNGLTPVDRGIVDALLRRYDDGLI
ncbi:MAG TPA: hypothetical protein VJZ76_07555 [Thermoanaerobaculia bacterium]|nr:hypothetical protein [Thermoanaerobaculia bacterium]